jgi:hypothetical protein
MSTDTREALAFVRALDFSNVPHKRLHIASRDLSEDGAAAAASTQIFDSAKSQAQVAGSGVFSFAQGVDPDVRAAISDSALLAQLVANQKISAEDKPLEWFAAYFDVLTKIGWTLQESAWTDYSADGTAVAVHDKILEVMTAALGPSPAALAILTATINALKSMNPGSPWLTIFNRESQKARIARFQIGLVDKQADGDVFVSLLACLVEAHSDITQVLFFKYKNGAATFKASSGKVSINRPSLNELGPKIREKISRFQSDYLSGVLSL